MGTTAIQTLRPNVSQNEAVQAFSARGVFSLYWKMRSGPLQRIADAYVPFWLYRVQYDMGKTTESRLFAMDAVDGSLDLFEFPQIPGHEEFIAIETRNCLSPSLTNERAEELLREKVWRVIFQQGFFKIREPKLEVALEAVELHLPYWLGLYGGKSGVRCRVMDAVRRRMEGAKASAFFEEWLAA
jgi:hypothetical protein